MPRKTDSNNPSDWLWFAASDLELIAVAAKQELSFVSAHSKLAEVLEKVIKAELLRLGWRLVKTHNLNVLHETLVEWNSDLADLARPLCKALEQVYFTDRYPGYDLEDPDWPRIREELAQVQALFAAVQERVARS